MSFFITSTGPTSDTDARDRIGSGPWVNASAATIAASVADLHSDANQINKETGLDENGWSSKATATSRTSMTS